MGGMLLQSCGSERGSPDGEPLPLGVWRVEDPQAASETVLRWAKAQMKDGATSLEGGALGEAEMRGAIQKATQNERYEFKSGGGFGYRDAAARLWSGNWRADGQRYVAESGASLPGGRKEHRFEESEGAFWYVLGDPNGMRYAVKLTRK